MTCARWMTTANFWLYCLPYFVVTMGEHEGPAWTPALILSVGLGGYMALLVVSVGIIPAVLRRMGRPTRALRWMCAAMGGTVGSLVFVVTGTILRLPYGDFWTRLAAGATAAIAADATRAWVRRKYFDRICTWR